MPHSTTTLDDRRQALGFIHLLAERRGTRPAHGVGNYYAPGPLNYVHRGEQQFYVWEGNYAETWTVNYREVTR